VFGRVVQGEGGDWRRQRKAVGGSLRTEIVKASSDLRPPAELFYEEALTWRL